MSNSENSPSHASRWAANHGKGAVRGLVPLACGVLLALAVLPSGALGSTNWATGVEASLPANAGTHPNLALGPVSCASAGNCTAVGSYADSAGHEHGLLLTETSGTWATGIEPSLPANAGPTPNDGLESVSCASAGNCTAVGRYDDSSDRSQGLMLSETSGTWATGVEASLPANAGTNPNAELDSVSCASAGNCTAVGDYDNSGTHSRGLLLSETSGAWTNGVEAPLPANTSTSPFVFVGSVSCASAGNCTAVGNYTDTSGTSQGLLLAETSGTWATGVEPSLPANAGANMGAGLGEVSCALAGNCTAVGGYIDSSGHDHGLLLTETSGTWTSGVEAPLPANAGANQNVSIDSVSCASAGNCTAVARYDDISGHYQGLLLSEISGTWAAGVEASLPANAGTNPNADLRSVACASAGNCTAVGGYTDNSGHGQGLVLTETSGTWATGVEASLPANADANPYVVLDSVSCPSAGTCTAVGSYNDVSRGLLLSETSLSAPRAGSALALIGSPTSNGAGVTDQLLCAPSAPGPCRATETLTTSVTTQGGRPVALSAAATRKRRTVVVATKRVTIHPGKKATVRVKLNATGRKLQARFRKLPVILKITLLHNGRHLKIANTKLTVKQKKR